MEPGSGKLRLAADNVREALRYCPSERRAMVFELSALAGGAILAIPVLGGILKTLGRGFAVGLQGIAPAIDMEMGGGRPPPPSQVFRSILRPTAIVTIIFCFFVTAFFAWRSGTLFPLSLTRPAEGASISFLSDWWNIVLYLVVVPLYVSCAVFLIYITAISWKRMNAVYASEVGAVSFWSASTRIIGFFTVSFVIAGFYIAEYIADLADPEITKYVYWFFSPAAESGRTLNRAGYYYVFLNAVLLFITAMAAFCYIALSIEIFRFGKFVPEFLDAVGRSTGETSRHAALAVAEAKIQETLDEYAYSYIIAKVLVATYAVNVVLWQMSPASLVANVDSAIVALAIIGLIFLVVPRLYLNSRWHRVKFAVLKEAGKTSDPSIGEELKPRRFRRSETWLDAIFLFLLFRAANSQLALWKVDTGLVDFFGAIFG